MNILLIKNKNKFYENNYKALGKGRVDRIK